MLGQSRPSARDPLNVSMAQSDRAVRSHDVQGFDATGRRRKHQPLQRPVSGSRRTRDPMTVGSTAVS